MIGDARKDCRKPVVAACAKGVVLVTLVACGLQLGQRGAQAGPGMSVAAAAANGGLGGCANYAGKAVYDCVAGVLDRLAGSLGGDTGQTAGALRTAAS